MPTAIRTLARWENSQPPHGQALVRLAQMAEAQGLRETAAKFVRALQAEKTDQDAAGQLELKGWLDGVRLAFHYRYRFYKQWVTLAEQVLGVVNYATRAAAEVSRREGSELEGLARQLKSSLENFKEGGD